MLRFDVKSGPTGSLFGSVTTTDIADEIWRIRKIRVDRRKIEIDNIKRIGRYTVTIGVFEDVSAEVKLMVVPEGGELPPEEELAAMVAAEEAAAAEAAAAAGGRPAEVGAADGRPSRWEVEVEVARRSVSSRRRRRACAEATRGRYRGERYPAPAALTESRRSPKRPQCLWSDRQISRSQRRSAVDNPGPAGEKSSGAGDRMGTHVLFPLRCRISSLLAVPVRDRLTATGDRSSEHRRRSCRRRTWRPRSRFSAPCCSRPPRSAPSPRCSRPGDFYRDSHGTIYKAALALYGKGEPVDAITLANELDERSELERVGGTAKIAELAAVVPATSNAEHYARIVKEMATLRGLVRVGQEIQRLGQTRPGETTDLVDRAEQMVFELAQERVSGDFAHIHDLLNESFARIMHLYEAGVDVTGVPSGFRELDKLTSGFQPGNLVIIAARPSMGKSALALCTAANLAVRHETPVALFTLEMSKSEVTQRLMCSEAKVESQRLRSGRLAQDDWPRLTAACDKLMKAPIYVDDTGSITMMELRSKARRLKSREPKLGMIIVDYLQLMTSGSNPENRVQEVSQISRQLKVLARDLEVPILALSQLSRAVEQRHDKRPILSDLRESGSIEQDADLVAFVYRDEYYNGEESDSQGLAEVILAKHRNGPTDSIKLSFLKRYAKFTDMPPRRRPGAARGSLSRRRGGRGRRRPRGSRRLARFRFDLPALVERPCVLARLPVGQPPNAEPSAACHARWNVQPCSTALARIASLIQVVRFSYSSRAVRPSGVGHGAWNSIHMRGSIDRDTRGDDFTIDSVGSSGRPPRGRTRFSSGHPW